MGEYGWTGRRTARVAHKRAGRRLRLFGDLERFSMLQRPLRPLRTPVDASWWRHKETHLAPVWALHPGALQEAVVPADALHCSAACMAMMLSAASSAAAVRYAATTAGSAISRRS